MDAPAPTYRLIAAAVLLLAYLTIACILLYQLYHPGSRQPNWNEVLVIYNAIGALATTSVGVLLGVEIQQGNVNSAQRSAQSLAAAVAAKDAAALRALEHLEPSAGVAASASADISSARVALQQSLGAHGG